MMMIGVVIIDQIRSCGCGYIPNIDLVMKVESELGFHQLGCSDVTWLDKKDTQIQPSGKAIGMVNTQR